MSDPTAVTMNTVQISANLLFGKMVNGLALFFLIAGLALFGFIAYWYVKVRKRK
jgi:hypothetical protein